jgi:hypothetical protein
MSKARRQEVDYFPHHCEHGRVLFILEGNFGNDGYAVFYKIQELLAKTNGHCYNCSPPENWEYLLSKMNVPESRVMEIINKLVSMKIFDPDLWLQKHIWMQSFVDSVVDAYARRKCNVPSKPVVDTPIIPVSGANVDISPSEQELSGINVDILPQRKVKERKVNISPPEYTLDFEQFWKLYPNKRGSKKDAFMEWNKLNGMRPSLSYILDAVQGQLKSRAGEDFKYWKHAERWIKGQCWESEGVAKRTDPFN